MIAGTPARSSDPTVRIRDVRVGRVGLWNRHLDRVPAREVRVSLSRWEHAGYGCVWIPEARGKEAMANAATILAATDQIATGTGIANVWARDAMAMEAGARTLLDAFPKRFVLGIGVSFPALVERVRGHRFGSHPLGVVRDYLEAMRTAPYEGPPVPPPPRILAALGPRMLDLAGTQFDGAHSYFVPPEHTSRARGVVKGRALVVQQAAVIVDGGMDGLGVAREYSRTFLDLAHHRSNLLRLGFHAEDLERGGSDALIKAIVAVGTVKDVAERVEVQLAAGADHVCVELIDPHDPLATGGYERLARELAFRGTL